MATATGRCECGGVRFDIVGPLRDVWNCHCLRCRRFTGHYMAGTRAAHCDVEFSGDATLRWYQPAADVAYGFCAECGSSLFWKCDARPDYLVITAGCLDQPTGLRTTAVWWAAEHGDYHLPVAGLDEHEYDG